MLEQCWYALEVSHRGAICLSFTMNLTHKSSRHHGALASILRACKTGLMLLHDQFRMNSNNLHCRHIPAAEVRAVLQTGSINRRKSVPGEEKYVVDGKVGSKNVQVCFSSARRLQQVVRCLCIGIAVDT